MVDIHIFINNGNEAFGVNSKTLTVDEDPKNISLEFVADELKHRMPLVPDDVIRQVLTGFNEVVARFMAEGFAIQGTNTVGDVMLRYYCDARLKCQSINLQKAKELMPGVVTDEQSMVEHAGELVALAGVQLRPYVEVRQKFHDLLAGYKPKYEVKGIKERPYVARRTDDDGDDGSSSDDNGGDSDSGQQADGTAPVLTIQKTGTGTMTVTDQTGHQIDSGAAVQAGQTLTLSVTPAGSATPTATIGAQAVTLTEDEGQYVGTFQMSAASATLTVRTGGSGDNEE